MNPSSQAVSNVEAEENASSITQKENGTNQDPEYKIMAPSPQVASKKTQTKTWPLRRKPKKRCS